MPQTSGLVNVIMPTKIADGAAGIFRQSKYGEVMMMPVTAGTYSLADEGAYYKCTNPTPGTGIADAIRTSFSATAGLFSIRNSESAGGKNLYMDYLTLMVTVAPATATAAHIVIAIDNITRYSSGGTAITNLYNASMNNASAANAVVHFGAITFAGESANVRRVNRSTLRGSIPIVNDTLIIQFGTADGASTGALSGAGAIQSVDPVGPIVIGPGHAMSIHTWYPGNATTAGSFEFECGFWMR